MRLHFFIDSSALYASLDSESGGARELVKLGALEQVRLTVSKYVFEEVERSFKNKGKSLAILALEKLKAIEIFEIIEVTEEEVAEAIPAVLADPKDAPIVAGAKKAKVNALISFDRKHLHTKTVETYINAPVVTPGEALRMVREDDKD